MSIINTDIVIIGGGLTGLTLAYLLEQNNSNYAIVEARTRLGGRILTKHNDKETPIELGATWLIEQQTSALRLLQSLHIDVFEQHYGKTAIYHPSGKSNAQLVNLPQNDTKSYRIKNGTHTLIEVLSKKVNQKSIFFNEQIERITLNNQPITVKSKKNIYHCKYIVSTLPPLLFHKTITVKPQLPETLVNVISKTHTWMHNSIRVGLTYKTPFWKENKTSGTIYCSVGAIQEFYDHSNAAANLFAISGFINGELATLTKKERRKLVINQLKSYYGNIALDYLSYEECVWGNENYTTIKSDTFLMPQTNNGHPIFQTSVLDNRLFIGGAETSPRFPGKMEGAITSAYTIFENLKNEL